MKFVYQPEGAEPRTWDFAPEKLMNVEAEAIERLTGMTYGEWGDAVTRGSMTAIHGLLYVLLKRADATLKWDAVQFCLADVDFEVDEEESEKIRTDLEKRVADGETLDEAEATLLEQLQKDADGDPKAPALEPVPDPTEPAHAS